MNRSKLILALARNNEEYNEQIRPRNATLRHKRTFQWVQESQFGEFNDGDDRCKENVDPSCNSPKIFHEDVKYAECKCDGTYVCSCSCVPDSDLNQHDNETIFSDSKLSQIIPIDRDINYCQQLPEPKILVEESNAEENIDILQPNLPIGKGVTSSAENPCKILSVIKIDPIGYNALDQVGYKKSLEDNVLCNRCGKFGGYCLSASEEESCDDDSRDIDYKISDLGTTSSDSASDSIEFSTEISEQKIISNGRTTIGQPLCEPIKANYQAHRKINRCKFCEDDVLIKNFVRHLGRHHNSEKEVRDVFALPTKSKQRRLALLLLRNDTNFHLFINGTIRPNRTATNSSKEDAQYYPCVYCKGLYLKQYLKRHAKSCKSNGSGFSGSKVNHISDSMTLTACAMDPTNVISLLNVKEQVFGMMKGDDIAFEAKKDLLIVHFGNSYLMKHRREKMASSCSNRMRELARLLIAYRRIMNKESDISFKDLLHPENFDNVVTTVRQIVGYDFEKKTFKAPSLAMHLGTSLKLSCDELTHLILKQSQGFKCKSKDDRDRWLQNVKNFKKLVIARWNTEISSLANKDLLEKRWQKPLLLPLVSDIKKFRDVTMELATECKDKFYNNEDCEYTYKLLVQCALSLLIVFNRRRIGDVQYLKVSEYKVGNKTNIKDFENALTETEKTLTTKYKRVVTGGKGSKAAIILVPEIIQKFMDLLLDHRPKYISNDNEYAFAIPGSKVKWGKGDIAIRTLAKMAKLESPATITSNKLRKHIATIMQILNLSKDEAKQFSTFMGHTQKTHDEFYELPVDVYQTAKVSKLLLMMEKGSLPLEYKGKSLAEININPDLEYAEEDDVKDGREATKKSTNSVEFVEINKARNKQTESAKVTQCGGKNKGGKTNAGQFGESDDATVDEVEEEKRRPLDTNVVSDQETKKISKKPWSRREQDLLQKEFKSYITKKSYPSGEIIKQFLKKNNIDRTVVVVRSKLQSLIKLGNK